MALELEDFRRLYEESFDTVYRYACSLTGNPSLAEDVAADTFMRAWRSRGNYRGDGPVLSWLLSITHNTAQTAIRRNRVTLVDAEVLERQPTGLAGPEGSTVSSESAAELHLAIRLLTPEQQQVIFMRFFENLSAEEVAVKLGRHATAIRSLQYRALRSLRRYLAENTRAAQAASADTRVAAAPFARLASANA